MFYKAIMFRNYSYIYFIGIGGIGMSALARWFMAQGCQVYGYDRSETALTQNLSQEGMQIHYQENAAQIPATLTPNNTLVIFTPAISAKNSEYQYFLSQQFTIFKRAEILGEITRSFPTIAIAGTHGKTTTTSMLGHILMTAKKPFTAFLGGILQNYNSNLLMHEPQNENALMLVEADEYDRSFLQLSPQIAAILSTDPDHLDIYHQTEQVEEAYKAFAKKVKKEGILLLNTKINPREHFHTEASVFTYGKHADYEAKNIRIENNQFVFDFVHTENTIIDIRLTVSGFHNVENATAAAAISTLLGIAPTTIKNALQTFKGAKRRWEYWLNTPEIVMIDDYAHHPTEIEALLQSVRALYPTQKITAIFQPHLYTRTRDFAEGFAKSLSLANEVLLLDIYPARELPIEGISANTIFKNIQTSKKQTSKENLTKDLSQINNQIVVVMGAGDIDTLLTDIKNTLLKQI